MVNNLTYLYGDYTMTQMTFLLKLRTEGSKVFTCTTNVLALENHIEQ